MLEQSINRLLAAYGEPKHTNDVAGFSDLIKSSLANFSESAVDRAVREHIKKSMWWPKISELVALAEYYEARNPEKVQRDVIIRDIRQMTEKLTLTFGVTDKDKAEYRQSLIKMKTELPPDLLAMLNKYCEDLRLTL